MGGNDFKLPDQLGWECNDEISKYLDRWMSKTAETTVKSDGKIDMVIWQVAKAELMDDVFAIITKYQEAKK